MGSICATANNVVDTRPVSVIQKLPLRDSSELSPSPLLTLPSCPSPSETPSFPASFPLLLDPSPSQSQSGVSPDEQEQQQLRSATVSPVDVDEVIRSSNSANEVCTDVGDPVSQQEEESVSDIDIEIVALQKTLVAHSDVDRRDDHVVVPVEPKRKSCVVEEIPEGNPSVEVDESKIESIAEREDDEDQETVFPEGDCVVVAIATEEVRVESPEDCVVEAIAEEESEEEEEEDFASRDKAATKSEPKDEIEEVPISAQANEDETEGEGESIKNADSSNGHAIVNIDPKTFVSRLALAKAAVMWSLVEDHVETRKKRKRIQRKLKRRETRIVDHMRELERLRGEWLALAEELESMPRLRGPTAEEECGLGLVGEDAIETGRKFATFEQADDPDEVNSVDVSPQVQSGANPVEEGESQSNSQGDSDGSSSSNGSYTDSSEGGYTSEEEWRKREEEELSWWRDEEKEDAEMGI